MNKLEILSQKHGVDIDVLKEIHGYSPKQAAELLGIPLSTFYETIRNGGIDWLDYTKKRFSFNQLMDYNKRMRRRSIINIKDALGK